GVPGHLLGSSPSQAITPGGWNTVSLSSALTLAAYTSYWLAYNSNGRTASVNNLRYDQTGDAAQGAYALNVAFGSWPDVLPSPILGDLRYSMYLTLDGSGVVSPSPTAFPSSTPSPSATLGEHAVVTDQNN